jgi:hypothetical protein
VVGSFFFSPTRPWESIHSQHMTWHPHPPSCMSPLVGLRQNAAARSRSTIVGQWLCQAIRALVVLPPSIPRDLK